MSAAPGSQLEDSDTRRLRTGVAPPVPGHPLEQPARRAVPLGEELPVFCERCGYSLHGLTQTRCDRCRILHFACPECGHTQPINTLRPALQRALGRLRAFGLGFWVLFKLNYFGWLLFAWVAMGVEWSYRGRWIPTGARGGAAGRMEFVPRELDIEDIAAFGVFALAFGIVSRMFLLRWRRGVAVGAILGALVALAALFGAMFRRWDISSSGRLVPSPLTGDFFFLMVWAFGLVVLGALVVWPIWMAVVHLFLPHKTAAALLEWQRSLSRKSPPNDAALARD